MAAGLIAISFLSCALAYAGLALMLRPGRLGRGVPRFRLRVSALATSAWALVAWWVTSNDLLGAGTAQLSAVILLSLWVWQLEPFARWQGQPRWFLLVLRWSGVAITAATILALSLPDGGAIAVRLVSLSGMVLASLGLFAIEQLFRNASAAAAPAVRWLCLGLGGVFVAELIVLAQSLLLGGIPVEPWVARGVVFALCAIAIGRGALNMPDWSFGISISRHVAFYTTSFLAIGGYLVLMSAAGWWLLEVEGWGRVAQIAFALLGGLTLVGLLYSTAMLRRLRVFISKNFYPHRYDYRREWLRFIQTLSDATEPEVAQKCIRSVAQIIESPHGSLWRRNDSGTRFEYTDSWGVGKSVPDGQTADLDDVLPEYLTRTGWLVDLIELKSSPGVYADLKLEVDRYAAPADALIVPLLRIDQLYGWLVLARPPHVEVLTFEDRDLLKTAGRHIATHLAQHDADARLSEARQFDAYNRMTTFIMHDLKNLAAQLRLVAQNAERHKQNPEFIDDAMRTVAAAAARMTKLITQLTDAGSSGTMRTVDLADIAERAAGRCSANAPVPQVSIRQRPTVFVDTDRLGAVIEHTILNAQEATPASGEVRVEIDRVDGHPVIRIVDTGCGMDQAFIRDRLFRPFDTTKGTKGMGIGAFQVREYLRSLGGNIEVQSTPGTGTTFMLVFPASGTLSVARLAG